MAVSLSLIIISGLVFGKVFQVLKLPPLLGMLAAGILLGSSGLSLIHHDIMLVSPDLRKIALLVILLRAGFGIEKQQLSKSGRAAVLLSTLPVLMEGSAVLLLGWYFLGLTVPEAGMLGFIIAAVSPAVIVPGMLRLIHRGCRNDSGVPTLVLAAASVDDVFAITLFSVFSGIYTGVRISPLVEILSVPISMITGMLTGIVCAFVLMEIFKRIHMRDTKKTLVVLGTVILLPELEQFFPVAALLGVMTLGFVLQQKYPLTAGRIASKLSKIWVFAEMVLFVLIGAQVNFSAAADAGMLGLIILFTGLCARSIGVFLAVSKTSLTLHERIFAAAAMVPKATVQAAIGAVPLTLGVPSGDMILAMAVMSVIITAPLGSIAIRILGDRWLLRPEIN